MTLATLLVLVTALAGEAASAQAPADLFIEEATSRLLEGGRLLPDYRLRLLELEPAERLRALAFLRRAGLLTGASWPAGDLLRPASGSDGSAR